MKYKVCIISPSTAVKGGISTVIKSYDSSEVLNRHFSFTRIPSHVDGSKRKKAGAAMIGLMHTFLSQLFLKPDLVHIHAGNGVSIMRKWAYFKLVKMFRCKVLFHFHGAAFMDKYQRMSPVWKSKIRKMFEDSELVICLSKGWEEKIKQLSPKCTTAVLPNGIKIPQTVNDCGNDDQTIRIAFLGLIGWQKGVFDLLHAIRRLKDQGYKLQLRIGGDGEIDSLKATIDELAIGAEVTYLGWLDDDRKNALLRKTDLLVLPSYGEGMPMVLLEAMSYGIGVVSTTVGGIPEMIENGKTGLLVEPGDKDELRGAIARLIKDPVLRSTIGKNARASVEKYYSEEMMSSALSKIYHTVISGNKAVA